MDISKSLEKSLSLNFITKMFNSFEKLKQQISSLEKCMLPVDKYYLDYFETDQHFCYHFIVIEQSNEVGVYAYDFLYKNTFFIHYEELNKAMKPSEELLSQVYKVLYFRNKTDFHFKFDLKGYCQTYKEQLSSYIYHLNQIDLKLAKSESSAYFRFLSKLLYQSICIMDDKKSFYREDIRAYFMEKNYLDYANWWKVQANEYMLLAENLERKPALFREHVNDLSTLLCFYSRKTKLRPLFMDYGAKRRACF